MVLKVWSGKPRPRHLRASLNRKFLGSHFRSIESEALGVLEQALWALLLYNKFMFADMSWPRSQIKLLSSADHTDLSSPVGKSLEKKKNQLLWGKKVVETQQPLGFRKGT